MSYVEVKLAVVGWGCGGETTTMRCFLKLAIKVQDFYEIN